MPDFPSIHHVSLTVRDLAVSVPWYRALFGSDPVIDEDTGPYRHVVWLVGGTFLGLHQFDGVDAGPDFDEHRLGLDHLSFGCADRAELESWQAHLEGLGISHGGIVDASYGSALSFRDPDNLPLELFALPS
jgi:catechol-2,3-dioxygenase